MAVLKTGAAPVVRPIAQRGVVDDESSRRYGTRMGQPVSYSYLTHLACPRCAVTYDPARIQGLCACGSPLFAQYDLDRLRTGLKREEVTRRPPDLWRYHELLPVASLSNVVTLGEGMTPLVALPRLGAQLGLERLWMKDEGLLPSGSFKARGAAVGVSKAHELGVQRIAMPTNGNAGAAWSMYAARCGMEALIVMPEDAPPIPRDECRVSGAHLFLVEGHIGDAGAIAVQAVREFGYFDAGTLREPYRLEGKKTMGLEIFEQLGWRVPDVIVYPTGGGVGIIGIHKALGEAQALGWISGKKPRLVAVQAEGCAPVVKAWAGRQAATEPWANPYTVAFGINVPKPLGDALILQALYDSEGCAMAVSDAAILSARDRVGAAEGVFMCPEGAACVAGVQALRQSGWIRVDDEVVILNTGTGSKYPYAGTTPVRTLHKGETLVGLAARRSADEEPQGRGAEEVR